MFRKNAVKPFCYYFTQAKTTQETLFVVLRFYEKEEPLWDKVHRGKKVLQTFCEVRFLNSELIRSYPLQVIESHTKSAKGMIP
jgi:hypothetical protein